MQVKCNLSSPPASIRGLDIWQHYVISQPVEAMCDTCIDLAEILHNDGRAKFWDALPGTFGLPGWDEIDKERDVFAWCVTV